MVSIASTIRAERARRDWSQPELADRAGVSVGTVVNAENEDRAPTVETLKRIANAFGVPVSTLIDDPAPAVPPPAQQSISGASTVHDTQSITQADARDNGSGPRDRDVPPRDNADEAESR